MNDEANTDAFAKLNTEIEDQNHKIQMLERDVNLKDSQLESQKQEIAVLTDKLQTTGQSVTQKYIELQSSVSHATSLEE